MHLAMQQHEIVLFKNFLSCAQSYFEFGTGGSTCLAASLVKGPICSVDSSKEWLDKVRDEMPASEFERRLVYADIGPTGVWGYPSDQSDREKFLNYHELVWADSRLRYELYLVDGRFRVACFAQIIKRMNSDSIVAMHDYRSRKQYHIVEKIARPVAEALDITFFTKRNDVIGVLSHTIQSIIETYKYNPE
jgi:hypothetical protein